MKKGTYSEKFFFRKTAVFFAERAFTITIEKHMDYIYGIFFVSKINLTYNILIMHLALVWRIFLFATFFFNTPRITLLTSSPLTTRSLL